MHHIPGSPLFAGLAGLLAGAIAAVSGFGIGSLLTPVFLLSLPAEHAIAAVSIPHALATAARWFTLRREVHGPTFRQFGIASAVGGLTGAALQGRFGGPVLQSVLGVLILMAGIAELVRRPLPLPATPFWRLAGGVLSGFFGGLVGNQGGIRSASLLGFRLPPRTLVATATASALLVDAARIPLYAVTQREVLLDSAPLWMAASAGALLGTFIGVRTLGRIPEEWYHRLMGVLLLALATWLLWTALRPA